jgi:hypothetical protein
MVLSGGMWAVRLPDRFPTIMRKYPTPKCGVKLSMTRDIFLGSSLGVNVVCVTWRDIRLCVIYKTRSGGGAPAYCNPRYMVTMDELEVLKTITCDQSMLPDSDVTVPDESQCAHRQWKSQKKDEVTYERQSLGYRLSPPVGSISKLSGKHRAAICAEVPCVFEVDLSWCTMAMMHAVAKAKCFPVDVTDELLVLAQSRTAIRAEVGKEHNILDSESAQVKCGKDKLRFATNFISPVLKGDPPRLPFTSGSKTVCRVLKASYKFWCCALMIDRYGTPVSSYFMENYGGDDDDGVSASWEPFHLLWQVYLYWVRKTPEWKDADLETLYMVSICGAVTSATPFDYVVGYPLEACLLAPDHAVGLGDRLARGLSPKRTGGRNKIVNDVGWTRCMKFVDAFKSWEECRIDSLMDTGANKLGILLMAGKVSRANHQRDPTFDRGTCCLASACSHYLSSMESRAVRVVRDALADDVVFISYLFDGFLVQLNPDHRNTADDAVSGLTEKCNTKLIESGFSCKASWDRIDRVPGPSKQRRLRRTASTDSDSDDVASSSSKCDRKRKRNRKHGGGIGTGFDGDTGDSDDDEGDSSPTTSDNQFIADNSDDDDIGDPRSMYARINNDGQSFAARNQTRVTPRVSTEPPRGGPKKGRSKETAKRERNRRKRNLESGTESSDAPPPPKKRRSSASKADIIEVVSMMKKWGRKHNAIRERNKDKQIDCRVFHQPDPNRAVYVDKFKQDGEAIWSELSNSDLIHLIIEEMDPDFYEEKFVDGKNWALEEHFVRWLRRTRGVKDFRRVGPSALNPGTIHAFRDGILLLYKFEEIGRAGRSLASVNVREVFLKWDDTSLKDYRDPDTGQFPLLCDSRHALDSAATDWLPMWPDIQANQIKRCPVILNTMIRQMLGSDFEAFVRGGANLCDLEEVHQQQLTLMMGIIGAASLPHSTSWGVATILSGPSGTGKTTFWSLVYESLIPEQIAEMRDADAGAHGESALRGAHFVYLGELDGDIKTVLPNGKRIISGERIPINPKNKDPETLNTRGFGSRDASGRDRTMVANVTGGATNEVGNNGWSRHGWDRRSWLLEFGHRVPDNEKDDSLKDAAKWSWGLEVPLCVVAMGKIKRMMDTPAPNGKKPMFLDLYPDETGAGLARRQTESILEVLNTTGSNEIHADWIKLHLVKKPGRCVDIADVYQKYIEFNGWDLTQKALPKNKFCELCTKLKFIERSNLQHNRIRICRSCEDKDTLSYGTFSPGHICGGVMRKASSRINVLGDCEYIDI